jgi:hypothetical protein
MSATGASGYARKNAPSARVLTMAASAGVIRGPAHHRLDVRVPQRPVAKRRLSGSERGLPCQLRANYASAGELSVMIRKLSSGRYRLYSRKKDPKTGRRRNLGTFATRAAAERHERAVQFFKRR